MPSPTPSFGLYLAQMRAVLSRWADLGEAEWQALAALFQYRAVPAQATLLLPGVLVHELLFVCEGLLRFYYVSEDGSESNKAFVTENTFAGALGAFVLDAPVLYGIQALEPATVLVARYADFAALFDQHPVFDRIGRRLAELLLSRKEQRMRSLLQLDAQARYAQFCADHPDLVQRVPQYHVASYLGISEVHLSRLRRIVARVS